MKQDPLWRSESAPSAKPRSGNVGQASCLSVRDAWDSSASRNPEATSLAESRGKGWKLVPHFLAAVGLTAAMPAQDSAPKAPPLATAAAEKKQGIAVTFTGAGKSDTRAARIVALFVPAGQPVSPFLPAGSFSAKWETEIISELRAEYTFSLETNGVATATLNGAPLLDSRKRIAPQPVQLQKGANKLVVEFESPKTGGASLRLLWSSKEFPSEPVPPTVFQHNANAVELRTGERLREGRLLFAQHRCAACHDGGTLLPPRGEGMPELAQDAPLFDEIGGKFREPWLAAWINDPHSIRPHSLMPRVFTGGDGKIDQRAADLAAYFASTATPKDGKGVEETPMAPGGALFANLGCVACHTKPDADGEDSHQRVPLRHVKAKWHPAALAEFLKDPAKSYRWIRMPHFRLSDTEAKQLASYLLSTGTQEFSAGPEGDSARGLQLMISSNCLSCHAGAPPVNTPTLAATLTSGWSKGCLAPDAAARGKAPDFRFSSAQRAALVAFVASGFDSLKHDVPAEFAARQIKNLRCSACHGSDGQPGVWSQLEEEIISLQTDAPIEEGEDKPIHTTALPALTWFGEKLRPDYLATFIAGGAKDKPRHWIVGRMPGFATYAEGLAHGLAHTHGLSTTIPAEPAPDAAKVKAGETLVGESGGFNCVQCHTVADRAATAVFEAPGPNLALSPARLRRDYFHRWALAPPHIDPETKMPKFADDEGKTPLTDFFDGKASEQFDAIWQYLRTLKR